MKTRKQIKREARRLFKLCLVDGLLDELRVRQVAKAILQAKRRDGYALLSNFMRWVKLDRNRHAAAVETATPLPGDLQASVLTRLDLLYGPGLSTSFAQNPSLIGGMRIKVASDLYDGSTKAALAALEKRF